MADNGVLFDAHAAQRIANAVRRVEGMSDDKTTDRAQKKAETYFKNNAGEDIPAYAVMKITSTSDKYLVAAKPDTTFTRNYAVNSPTTSKQESGSDPYSGRGHIQNKPVVRVLYDTGSPANGETWGPAPGQWELKRGYPGFTCLGIVDADQKIMLARVEPYDTIIGKLTGALTDGANTVNVWTGDGGSEAVVTGWTVSARPWWDVGSCTYPVSTSAKVVCKNIDGQWYIMPLPWDRTQISGYSGSVVQYLKHDTSGCLAWETPEECP